jgi:predicted dienelactone hydrolase
MRAEAVTEARRTDGWAEDFFLVALFAAVGALGMAVGIATDSQVQVSIGLILMAVAARVLADIVRQRS